MEGEGFVWYWEDGATACEPPEPDKEWIVIADTHGEEYAIIMHRRHDHPESDYWRAQKEVRAGQIVVALNTYDALKGGPEPR